MRNGVFLDSVGFLALWNRQDQWHQAAVAAHTPLAAANIRLVATNAVFLECGNALARTHLRSRVVQTRQEMILAGDLIEPLDSEVHSAWTEYAAGVHGSAGIVDLLSFAVMRRLGISKAFTNDRHFRAAGFDLLF